MQNFERVINKKEFVASKFCLMIFSLIERLLYQFEFDYSGYIFKMIGIHINYVRYAFADFV